MYAMRNRGENNMGRTRFLTIGIISMMIVCLLLPVGSTADKADDVMNNYIATEITDDMTDYQKAKKITEIVARDFSYMENASHWQDYIEKGGGDCWASAFFIVEACRRMGIQAEAHDDYENPYTGYLHRYALVNINGEKYVAEAGNIGTAPRQWYFLNALGFRFEKMPKRATYITGMTSEGYTMETVPGPAYMRVERPMYYMHETGKDKNITIPTYIDQIPVREINWNFNKDSNTTETCIFPGKAEMIDPSAFENNIVLKTVYIPASLTSISTNAFKGCTALTDVYYGGTEKQAQEIKISAGNDALNNATWHYNYLQTGLQQINGRYVYFDSEGCVNVGFYKEDGKWHYVSPITGTFMKDCWNEEEGKWYYFLNDGAASTGWTSLGGAWYLMDQDGVMQTGWAEDKGKWYFMNGTGEMRTGWVTANGKWYFMAPNSGEMQTGWVKCGGAWYYMDGSGAMQTGWVTTGGRWYLMNESGEMRTGWVSDGTAKYYLSDDGSMYTGWKEIGGTWYYFNPDGSMATGWQKIGGAWYYFYGDGSMATGWLNDGGAWYYFNGGGAMMTGWLKLGSTWYYFSGGGVMVTGQVTVDGRMSIFDGTGAWLGYAGE